MRVTRKMGAERAGVSKESVSYVLNRSRPVSDEIVKRVMDAVNELGYVPDVMARSLNNKNTMSVGVICNDLSNPYYSEIISGIQECAERYGYTILIADATRSIRKTMADMVSRRVDGICFLVFPDKFNFDYSAVLDSDIRIIVTHNVSFHNPSICHLEPHFSMGIREALLYLKECGHTEISMLSAFSEEVEFDNRLTLFQAEYRELFGREPKVFTLTENFESTLRSGKFLAEQFLLEECRSTAVICTNDLMAIGALQCFRSRGIRVPEDISIVGIDDMIFSSLVTPRLTTIGYNKREFGRALMELLYQNMSNGAMQATLFPLKLVVRESTMKIC